MMLLALMAFGVGMVFARKGSANVAQNSLLNSLKVAVSKPDVKLETWLKYGQALQSASRLKEAAVAYDQVLKTDPYQCDALRGCAQCRALLGDADVFFKFMRETVDVDPKLTKAVFEQPYATAYLAENRFQELKKYAIAQSMD